MKAWKFLLPITILVLIFCIPSSWSENTEGVYGPQSPYVDEGEEVFSFVDQQKTTTSSSVQPPLVSPQKTKLEIKKQEEIKSQELEEKLNTEREKLAEEKVKQQEESLRQEKEVMRLEAQSSSDLVKHRKKTQKYYGMTVSEINDRWNSFKENSSELNSVTSYKDLEKQDRKLIKAQVKLERAALQKRFPNLDKKYFKEVVNKKDLLEREIFLAQEAKSLEEVVMRAMEVFIPVRIAKEKEKTAKIRLLKSFRDLFPEMDVELNEKGGSLSQGAFTGDSWRINLKQPIFRGGTLWNAYKEERASYKASKEESLSELSELVMQVAEAYLNYSRAQTLFTGMSDFSLRMNKLKIQNVEKRKAGIVSEIEFLNTDSLLGELRAELETSYQDLALAQLDLSRFLKLPEGEMIEVDSMDRLKNEALPEEMMDTSSFFAVADVEKIDRVSQQLEDLVEVAYQNRADLRLEEFKLLANRHKLKGEVGKLLPQFDVILETGQTAESFLDNNPDPSWSSEFKFGVETTSNVFGNTFEYSFDTDQRGPSVTEFQGGSGTRTNTHKFTFALFDAIDAFVDEKEARIQMMEQMVELQEKENEVVKEVKETFYGYNRALIQLDSTVKKMEHRKRVAQLKFYQLGKNQIQISEYLQAEKDLLDAKQEYTQSVSDFIIARISLNKAIGKQDILKMESFQGKVR